MTVDPLLVSAVEERFGALATAPVLAAAERDGWSPALWAATEEMGLPAISVPEEAGGQGGTVADALAVLRVAGRYAVPLPLAETGLLAGWMLAASGLPMPSGPVTTVAARDPDTLTWDGTTVSGSLSGVPWARSVAAIVVLVGDRVVQFAPDSVAISPRTNLAGEPRDVITADRVTPVAAVPAGPGVDLEALRLRGALTRIMLMAGALERVLDLTVRYTGEREQFGRPVARFQAVQEHLVHLGQQAALAGMAADVAAREYDRGVTPVEVWAAKTVCGQAARIATRAAHQAHGAMGMTQEYPLHHLTRRLWSWTREYDDLRWARLLGTAVIDRGADRLYPLIAGGSAALAT